MESLELRLGPLVKKRREERGMSHDDLAKAAGVAVRTVQNMETGTIPRLDNFGAVARVLGIKADDLWTPGSPTAALSADPVNRFMASDAVAVISSLAETEPLMRGLLLGLLFEEDSMIDPEYFERTFALLRSRVRLVSKPK